MENLHQTLVQCRVDLVELNCTVTAVATVPRAVLVKDCLAVLVSESETQTASLWSASPVVIVDLRL